MAEDMNHKEYDVEGVDAPAALLSRTRAAKEARGGR